MANWLHRPAPETSIAVGSDRASDPGRAASRPGSNLPVPISSLVGRGDEIRTTVELLRGDRLVTLVGPGGIGKTRLAIEVASASRADYEDGPWFVDLAPLGQPELVPQTVAGAMGLREEPGRPITRVLIDHLSERRVLVVLDNCEHLIGACAELAESLLEACAALRVLATSREPLRIGGERVVRVPPLKTHSAGHGMTLERVAELDSVRLFTARARATNADFALSEANAPAVAQICRRLDGIPLALELAAARIGVLGADEIVARLDDRFRLLSGGSRTALPRHQTLRALVDWSYQLLPETEKAVFRRVSAFAGGWTLEAAENVCAGGAVAASAVLDSLTSLIDKNLVIAEDGADGSVRYRLLETLRQFGREELTAAGEGDAAVAAHTRHFLQLAHELEPEFQSAGQLEAFDAADREHDNFRAILSRGAPGDAPATELAAALSYFWYSRNYWTEGLSWSRRVAPAGDPVDDPYALRALSAVGMFAALLGDARASAEALERAIPHALKLADGRTVCLVVINAFVAKLVLGQFGDRDEGMRRLRDDVLAAATRSGFDWAGAMLEAGAAMTASLAGNPAVALTGGDGMLARCERVGDRLIVLTARLALGRAAVLVHDLDAAELHLAASVGLARELGNRHAIALNLRSYGQVALARRDYANAAARFEEGLRTAAAMAFPAETAGHLAGLAGVAAGIGRPEAALQLLGAVAALRARSGVGATETDRALEAAVAEAATAQLAGADAAPIEAGGSTMSSADATALALEVAARAQRAIPA